MKDSAIMVTATSDGLGHNEGKTEGKGSNELFPSSLHLSRKSNFFESRPDSNDCGSSTPVISPSLRPNIIRQARTIPKFIQPTDNYSDRGDNSVSDSIGISLARSCPSAFSLTSSKRLLRRHPPDATSDLRRSLRRLNSSHRLSVTCSGSDLSQLYLSGPEQQEEGTTDLADSNSSGSLVNVQQQRRSSSQASIGSTKSSDSWWSHSNLTLSSSLANDGAGAFKRTDRRGRKMSWIEAADLYGQRKSFSRKRRSYARFLDADVTVDAAEQNAANERKALLLIEEHYGDSTDNIEYGTNMRSFLTSPRIVVPSMMLLDLVLGVSLSLYDSHLLRNVPGFRFPLIYAFIQKTTNAIASLSLIFLSRRQEIKQKKISNATQITMGMHHSQPNQNEDRTFPAIINEGEDLTQLPNFQTFRNYLIPLTGIALVQTLSAAFANQSLLLVPLPLFKVVLMCGPIFVACITTAIEGQVYSRSRVIALSLIGLGACRAVYAEAEIADNPRNIMEGTGFALGACAFSGIGLVMSSALMHRGEEEDTSDEDAESTATEKRSGNASRETIKDTDSSLCSKSVSDEFNPLSLLFYLSCEQVIMLGMYLCPWEEVGLPLMQQSQDRSGEFVAFRAYFVRNPSMAICYLMTGSTMALALAILTFVLVNRTSPVAASLLGNVRSIATVAISSILMESGGSGGARNVVDSGIFGSASFGYVLTLFGGAAYALAALG